MSEIECRVDINAQQLKVLQNRECIRTYSVSTGLNGAGENKDSGKTPRGWHIIRAKIGAGMPELTVFRGRRPLETLYSPEQEIAFPNRDWILGRILWLSGLEVGKNRLGECDTMQRYIYIHGCSPRATLGVPGSKGCIRMRNKDVIELFDTVSVGTKILIQESSEMENIA